MSIPVQVLDNAQPWRGLAAISSGGTVFGLAISPVEDVNRLWAATGCGIYLSDDGGETWVQSLEGLTTPLLSALTVSPNGALFAGALDGDLFASFDYGATWERGLVPEEFRGTVTFVVTSPNFRKDGTAFAATDGGGLLVTRSSGKTWEDSGFGLGDLTVLALATAGDWSEREVMFAATMEGVFVSRNGGRAWRETELIMSDDVVDVLATSPSYEADHTVFAGTEAGNLYRSTNSGRTWDLVQKVLGDGPINCLWVAPDFCTSGTVVVSVGAQVKVSTDGGESLATSVDMPSSVLALAGNEGTLLAGMHDAGVFKSTDGGKSWSSASKNLAARGFARLVAANDKLYAMGPQEGLWVSDDEGATWRDLEGLRAYLPISAVAAVAEGDLFAVSHEQGIVRSSDGGASWHVVCAVPGIQTVDLAADGRGWAGTSDGQLLATTDGGATWRTSASPCSEQEILSIAVSPTFEQDHTVFLGSVLPASPNRQGRVALWRSSNGGETWRQITTQVTPARWVDIQMPRDVVENAADHAVLATGAYCLRPLRRAKDVWISTRVDPNEANTLAVAAVGAIDQGGVLFAATGRGIYRSIDGGRTWQTFSQGLGGDSFLSLTAVQGNEGFSLYALSLGGILWRRDLY
jgi:photosystem II stability/assembly factor-like uncharacterized protein